MSLFGDGSPDFTSSCLAASYFLREDAASLRAKEEFPKCMRCAVIRAIPGEEDV